MIDSELEFRLAMLHTLKIYFYVCIAIFVISSGFYVYLLIVEPFGMVVSSVIGTLFLLIDVTTIFGVFNILKMMKQALAELKEAQKEAQNPDV